ncbi:MAG: hypothetical protein HKN59_02730 [Gammaproteobacteria bacterium]|nr:hypothetical protein [Gammaproteobacteria bacterium]
MRRLIPATAILVLLVFGSISAAIATEEAGADGALVRQLVRDWAAAWRAGKFSEYAAYYVAGFKGPYESHEKWRQERSRRIEGRGDIRVDLGPMLVQFNLDDSGVARAIFLQSYRSNTWCDVVEKTLGFEKTDTGWRISSEESTLRSRC